MIRHRDRKYHPIKALFPIYFFSSVYAAESASAVPPYNSLLIVSKVYHTFPSLQCGSSRNPSVFSSHSRSRASSSRRFSRNSPLCARFTLPADLPLGGTEATAFREISHTSSPCHDSTPRLIHGPPLLGATDWRYTESGISSCFAPV